MPVDFDFDDIDPTQEETETVLQETEEAFAGTIDSQMSVVETRLEQAQYYRLLLNDSIFSDPGNPVVAQIVEDEIKEFVRERMSVLVGVGSTDKKSVFSDEEVTALRELASSEVVDTLKALVSRLLKKPLSPVAPLEDKPKSKPKLQPKVMKTPSLKQVSSPQAKVPQIKTIAAKTDVVDAKEAKAKSQPKTKPSKGKAQKRVYKEVTLPDGEVKQVDITPQAKSETAVGAPVPRTKQEIEYESAAAAGRHGQFFHTNSHIEKVVKNGNVQ